MTKLFFNNKFIDKSDFLISHEDRGFQYGDGLFETLYIRDHKVRFLDFHVKRLKDGCKALHLDFAPSVEEFQLQIDRLCKQNKVGKVGRGNIFVWRKSGGLYTPEQFKANCVVSTTQKRYEFSDVIENAVFSTQVALQPSAWSRFKTINALPYVLAGIEKKTKGAKEIIICNHDGKIAETGSSNIFWLKSNVLFTPSLDSGCIAGVMRRFIIENSLNLGFKLRQGLFEKQHLLGADKVFTTNATGVSYIARIGGDHLFDIEPILSLASKINAC